MKITGIGDVFYVRISRYEGPKAETIYAKHRVVELSPDGKTWLCGTLRQSELGKVNKRSGKFRYDGNDGRTHSILSEREKYAAEFSRQYRHKLARAVSSRSSCDNERLLQVAQLLEFTGEDQ